MGSQYKSRFKVEGEVEKELDFRYIILVG